MYIDSKIGSKMF